MADNFVSSASSLDAPADNAWTITPHDSTDEPQVTRALYVGGAGDISVEMNCGAAALFSAVPAGTILPIRVKRVNDTGTTATLMVGLE